MLKKRKKVDNSTGKENLLSEKSQNFLGAAGAIFGDLVRVFIAERLKGLSEEDQFELVWHILHFMYHDVILPTGNPDVDIRLSEVIEVLPFINIEVFRFLSRGKIAKMANSSETIQYGS